MNGKELLNFKILSQQWLFFYPRLKHSTKVSERHAMLIFEKIPGGKFRKIFLKGGMEYGAHSLLIVGIIIGIVFGRQVFRRDVVGSLRIDQSDPDSGPYLFLECCPIRERMRYIRKDM